MKRHEALAPLSREHHGALILAQLIKKDAPVYRGLPTDVEGRLHYAVSFYTNDLILHFRKEEAMLEKVKYSSESIRTVAEEIIGEHVELKNRFLSLSTATDKEKAMDELGFLLEAHIRKEERVLFPLIQENCSEELLSQLHKGML